LGAPLGRLEVQLTLELLTELRRPTSSSCLTSHRVQPNALFRGLTALQVLRAGL